MMSAVRSILCFDAMRAATRRSKGFSVADIATGDFRETEVRAYLRLCMARGAVEIVPERRTRAGRHVILYRAVDDLPPLLPPTDDEAPQVRKLLMARLVTRKRDADLAAKQSNMWTALRALRVVDARALAFHARTEDVQISTDTARLYLGRLFLSNYVSSGGDGYFRLSAAKNTGPFAVLAMHGLVVDLNLMRPVNVTAQPLLQHDDGRAA